MSHAKRACWGGPQSPMPPAGGRLSRPRAAKNKNKAETEGAAKLKEKEYFLSVRLTKEEREHLKRLADESGLTMSGAVRACVAGTEIRRRPPSEIKDLYAEVNRIGNNINQIARSVNAGIANAEDARQALFLLRKVYDLMEAVADK